VWRQGEHVILIGDTGTGKTYLMRELLAYRKAVLILRTKSDDIAFPGYKRVGSIQGVQIPARGYRYVVDPLFDSQATVCRQVLDTVWREKHWTVAIDELYYAVNDLGLVKPINRLLTQGRGENITVVMGEQRPVSSTRFAIAESTHVFSFGLEGRDLKTVVEATTPRFKPVLESLKRYKYEYGYFNRKRGEVAKGTAQTLASLME
jgi:hypothetical protein